MIKQSIISVLFFFISFSIFGQSASKIKYEGLIFGASLGIANTIQSFPYGDKEHFSYSYDVNLGKVIGSRLALLVSSNTAGYEYEEDRSRGRKFSVLTPCVQYWFSKRLSFLGGIGVGLDAPVYYDIEPDNLSTELQHHVGIGGVTALAYDFYENEGFAFTVKAKCTYRDVKLPEGSVTGFSPAILIGINIY